MILNDRYRIISSLRSGGFGETFIAEDTKIPSKRRCVIKRLRPVNDDPATYQTITERFQREAAILENLGNKSNQIPTLYAYFEENGSFYLAQELIEGKTLSEAVAEHGSFCETDVKKFLTELLPVLVYVHSEHIVHRDINPENILIRQFDNKPVLIDFGAVKESMTTILTVSGNMTASIVIGTPGFMPSEQVAGRPVYSSDLYAVGLTAIYLLTAKLPQTIEVDHRTGQILWKQYAQEISNSFASVLDKAIHPQFNKRYSTAREMLQALQQNNQVMTSLTTVFAKSPVTRKVNGTTIIVGNKSIITNSRKNRKVTLIGIFLTTLIAIEGGIYINLKNQLTNLKIQLTDLEAQLDGKEEAIGKKNKEIEDLLISRGDMQQQIEEKLLEIRRLQSNIGVVGNCLEGVLSLMESYANDDPGGAIVSLSLLAKPCQKSEAILEEVEKSQANQATPPSDALSPTQISQQSR